jgi:hypothetical protein
MFIFTISSRHVALAHRDEVLAGVILFEVVDHAGVGMIEGRSGAGLLPSAVRF